MAIEYLLETVGDASAEQTLRYFAEQLGATVADEGFAQRDGLHIMTSVVPADEIEATEYLLGYHDVISTTFRFLNNTDPVLEQRNLADVVTAAVAYLEDTPDQRGVFTHEGERILFQRLSSEPVIFDTAWRNYTLNTAPNLLNEIEQGHRQDGLPQPILSNEDLETLRNRRDGS